MVAIKAVSVGHAIVSLGGGWVRRRPPLGVTVIGPTDTVPVQSTAWGKEDYPGQLTMKFSRTLCPRVA
jgi:hypothetical protein